MLLGGDATNTVAMLPLSLLCAEWRMETVSGSDFDYLPLYNAIDSERELEDFKNFFTLYQLHSPIDENTSARIDKSSALDRAKVGHFALERHRNELFEIPISA